MIHIYDKHMSDSQETQLHHEARIENYFNRVLMAAAGCHGNKILHVEGVKINMRPIKSAAHSAWYEDCEERNALSITINTGNQYPLVYRAKEGRTIYDADALLFDEYAHAIARYLSKFRPRQHDLTNETEIVDSLFYHYNVTDWSAVAGIGDLLWEAIENTRDCIAWYRARFGVYPLPESLVRRLYIPDDEVNMMSSNAKEEATEKISDPIRSLEL